MKEKFVISKSAKKKISSEVTFPVEVNGETKIKTVVRRKANYFTQQVVYKTLHENGKATSVTKHELIG